jgi:hypothetical protein
MERTEEEEEEDDDNDDMLTSVGCVYISSAVLTCANGFFPTTISYTTTPKDHISTWRTVDCSEYLIF